MDVVFPGFVIPTTPDPRLTGAHLLLVTPGREGGALSGTAYPNLAAAEAGTVVGTAVSSVTLFDTHGSAAGGFYEQTAMGAPHFITSQVSDVQNQATGLNMPASLAAYLTANTTHRYYLSAWVKRTRSYLSASPTVFPYAGFRQSLTTSLGIVGQTTANVLAGTPGSADPRRIGFTSATDGVELFISITMNGTAGTASVITNLVNAGSWAGAMDHKTPSFVLRSLALVDLDAGVTLTHAGLAAADQAEWIAARGVGGYYNGDTNSDPAVVCP